LATGSGNGEIALYQSAASASATGSKTPVVELEVFTSSPVHFDNLFFAPGSSTLFASARGFSVQSFSVTEGENGGEIRLVPANSNPIDAENVVSMALMPNPELLASISNDGEARIWQLPDGRFISIAEFNKEITSLAVSGFVESAPLIIALGFADGTIALYGVTEQPGQ
jgi:WD40 repeat protein